MEKAEDGGRKADEAKNEGRGSDSSPPSFEPKVTDFGNAKRKTHDLTQTNAMLGTPAYMAPEQAEAKAKFVGPQADVWALGVILYECLTDRRPFEGENVWVVLEKIIREAPPAMRTVSRAVPRDLETVVTKCLSKDAKYRYETTSELAADLRRFVNGEPVLARRVGTAERVARWRVASQRQRRRGVSRRWR